MPVRGQKETAEEMKKQKPLKKISLKNRLEAEKYKQIAREKRQK